MAVPAIQAGIRWGRSKMSKSTEQFLPAGPKLVEYAAKSEPWCEYQLEDGTILRVRIMVCKVIDEDKFTDDGYPQYQLRMQQVIDMTWSPQVEKDAATRRAAK
jgi:hypothetical protein